MKLNMICAGFCRISVSFLIAGVLALFIGICGCHPEQLEEIAMIQASIAGDAEVFYGKQPPYSTGDGSKVHLINNESAVDPAWQEMVQFIVDDDTDERQYIEDVYVCGDFAATLHNNAERAGMRCAWVAAGFAGEDEEAHAFNAFNTVDRGIVFVDCVGERAGSLVLPRMLDPGIGGPVQEGTSSACDSDKVAYVEVGKAYGTIVLGEAGSTAYEFYENYMMKWRDYEEAVNACNAEIDTYNQKVAEYNEEVGGRAVIYDQSEYKKLKMMYEALEREKSRLASEVALLESQRESLGGCCWKPIGIVSRLEVYW